MWFSVCAYSQETLNAMFYNVFKFPTSLPQNRELILRDILDEYQPDLFMICELVNENGADLILNTSLQNQTDTFARAVFTPDLTNPSDPLQTMVFYNTRKLTLVNQQTLPTVYRDINHYSFELNVEANDPIYLEVFVAHLKSSTGPANRQMRFDMVEQVTQELQNLTQPDTYVLFSGDFNFYNSSEIGYQQILNPANAIVMIDPINAPGSWQDNASFSYLHTQSTRFSNSGFGGGANAGASGGLDDRFDFIFVGDDVMQGTNKLKYIAGTYKALGNDGLHYNKSLLASPTNTSVPFNVLQALYYMSDHLPIVMKVYIDEAVSVDEKTSKESWRGYFSNNKFVFKSDKVEQQINVQLIDILGKPIQKKFYQNQHSFEFDYNHLTNGLYFVKVWNNHQLQKTYRIVKQ